MKSILSKASLNTKQLETSKNAQLYDLSSKIDKTKLTKLLDSHSEIRVKDELQAQLSELIKLRYPKKKHSDAETKILIDQHLNNIPEEEYGIWVYYEWNNTLVHILDRDEFYEVKTNRNQHKITREEGELLSKQIVGVVGLSVGRTIAITMTMEHSYGEIRIADFDVLDLSNYNRIRAGLNDLGIKKTISVAREIAEIDPYVKVTCFNDGLTDSNIDAFFTEGGTLNALVDECDGLDIKILLREKAKALRIPVIMDMNDRGTMDIERFDLEPDRPLLHGFIGHLDSSKLKGLTNEQKIPYIMPMLGETTISTKLKASMLEIEQTLTTWPQLAADVTLGGAVAANVYRRIILDEFHDSGRYFVDMDELICDESEDTNEAIEAFGSEMPLSWATCAEIIEKTHVEIIENAYFPNQAEINQIIEAALLAPSGGNAQPWKWLSNEKTLFLFKDQFQSDTLLDYGGKAAFIGLGAALENLQLKASEIGHDTHINSLYFDNKPLVCSIQFTPNANAKDELSRFIGTRRTNRGLAKSAPILFDSLLAISQHNKRFKTTEVLFLNDSVQIDSITQTVAAVERIRMMEKRGHHDFTDEIRWTAKENEDQRNGIDIRTIELSAGELTGFRMAKDWKVIDQLNKWKGGGAFETLARKSMNFAGAIGIITLSDKTDSGFIEAGRLLERCWLEATRLELEFQPMTPSSFFFERLVAGNGDELSEKAKNELTDLRNEMLETLQLEDHPVFIFRLHQGGEPEVKSLRKALSEVYRSIKTDLEC
ncbi:MAG: hypothetical protein ACJA0U_000084 [Salibacteraceae bacterium]|jgi:hypothetical protein